ncbi:MAG: TSUP family transporter [Gammaproteobacteria bacterium]|nr:TSUP family transporter [Gammaproteobacteria bacterium]
MEFAAFILLGAFAGGFVNGLSGFGTSMVALAFWLYVVPPAVAVPLAVTCSLVSHLQTLPSIWHQINIKRVIPLMIGGAMGVPLGVYLLSYLTGDSFKLYLGILIVGYCAVMMMTKRQPHTIRSNSAIDAGVGFCGGILGGLSGLSGLLPTVWSNFQSWNKEAKRSVFQTYNLAIAAIALGTQATAGFITVDLVKTIGVALPGTVAGVWLGHWVYKRLGDNRFNQAIYIILTIAGLNLIFDISL